MFATEAKFLLFSKQFFIRVIPTVIKVFRLLEIECLHDTWAWEIDNKMQKEANANKNIFFQMVVELFLSTLSQKSARI